MHVFSFSYQCRGAEEGEGGREGGVGRRGPDGARSKEVSRMHPSSLTLPTHGFGGPVSPV